MIGITAVVDEAEEGKLQKWFTLNLPNRSPTRKEYLILLGLLSKAQAELTKDMGEFEPERTLDVEDPR